jgi:hypothetical protein
MSVPQSPPICAGWGLRRPTSCWDVTRMRCTVFCAALPDSGTIRACSTRLFPLFGTWQANRIGPGGSTRRNASENWLPK